MATEKTSSSGPRRVLVLGGGGGGAVGVAYLGGAPTPHRFPQRAFPRAPFRLDDENWARRGFPKTRPDGDLSP